MSKVFYKFLLGILPSAVDRHLRWALRTSQYLLSGGRFFRRRGGPSRHFRDEIRVLSVIGIVPLRSAVDQPLQLKLVGIKQHPNKVVHVVYFSIGNDDIAGFIHSA